MSDPRKEWILQDSVVSEKRDIPTDSGFQPSKSVKEHVCDFLNIVMTIAIIVIIGSGCGLLGWFGHELTSKPEFSVISQKISQKGQKRLAAVVDELPRVCANSNRTPEACGFLLEDGLLSVVQSEPKRYISQAKRPTADAPENKAE